MHPEASKLRDIRDLRFSVEGVGEVVEKFYFPALRYLRKQLKREGRDIVVTFYDLQKDWADDPNVPPKVKKARLKFIKDAQAWGATYIDKESSDGDGQRRYENRNSDVAFICTPDATHSELALKWLNRAELICVEKPFDRYRASAMKLLSRLSLSGLDNRVLAFDHYLARFLPSSPQRELILKHLGGRITSFTFYMLEDGSRGKYNGPIENAGRTRSLDGGMILDGLPHMAAILSYFGEVESICVTRVRAGQYTGVKYVETNRTLVSGETLAEVDFIFREHQMKQFVSGKAFVGKGVSGSKNIPFVKGVHPSDIKLLDVIGLNGQRLRFDLRRSGKAVRSRTNFSQLPGTAHYLNNNGDSESSFPLRRQPYHQLMESIVDGTLFTKGLTMFAHQGVTILRVLEDFKMRDDPDEPYATYPLGSKRGSAPLLEDALQRLSYVYGEPTE